MERVVTIIADVEVTRNASPVAPFNVHVLGDMSGDRRFDDFTDALTHAMARVAIADEWQLNDFIRTGVERVDGYGDEWDIMPDESGDGAYFAYWCDED